MNFTFNAAGFTTAMICLVILAALFFCHKWIKKITKYYWFWLAIGLFITIWVIVFRTVPCVQRYIELLKTQFDPKENIETISNALMLELCTFFGLFFPFSLVIDPSRKLARAIAPLALCGSICVVFGQFPFNASGFRWGIEYLFIGRENHELYAFMHIVNLFLGFGVLFNTPKYGWKGYLSFLAVLVVFYTYVGICIGITGCDRQVSGLTLKEWEVGFGYGWLATLTHWPAVACMSFGLPMIFILFSLVPYLNDHVLKRFRMYQFGNARTNKWYIWNSPNVYVKE